MKCTVIKRRKEVEGEKERGRTDTTIDFPFTGSRSKWFQYPRQVLAEARNPPKLGQCLLPFQACKQRTGPEE